MPAPQVVITPQASTAQLAEGLMELQRILTRGLGFGDAGTGTSLLARAAPGTPRPATRIGLSDNLFGSFVEVTLTAVGDLNVNLVAQHNLTLPAPAQRSVAAQKRAQLLNVRWIVAGIRYKADNAVVAPVGTDHRALVLYNDGAVGANSVELRFYTDLTLGGAQNGALTITLFMFPASA